MGNDNDLRCCWGLIVAFLLVSTWAYAETQLDRSIYPSARNDDKVWVSISGEISPTDVAALREIIAGPPASRVVIAKLNSDGGSVESSIEIGRILRRHHAFAIVEGKCLSSCVLVLAGATSRTALPAATVGIHRPYNISTSEIDFEKRQALYSETRKRVQSYLEEMNITPSLFDAMQQIPPESIRILTQEELAAFGLNAQDPVEAEAQNARSARFYGITVVEYLRRQSAAENHCSQLPFASKESNLCYTAILLGVSEPEAKKRIERISKECHGISGEAEKEACFAKVLQGNGN